MPKLLSPTVTAAVLAAVVGGAAGAGATFALSRPESKTAANKRTSAAQIAAESDDEDTLARLERLESEVRALRQRNTSSEALQKYAKALNRGKPSASDRGHETGSDGAEGSDDIAPVMDAEDPGFELAVRTVLDRVDWEREEERRVTESKRREERALRQTELLAERLKLTPPQKQSVQRILTEQMDTFRKLREGEDESARPATRGDWRARVEAIRTETEQRLAEVLDDGQMSSYREFVEEEGFGPPGRRGGRRDRETPAASAR